MKEQQFLRQVHKLESEAKKDLQRLVDKHENNVRARDRENEKAIEELEERLLRAQDEAEE